MIDFLRYFASGHVNNGIDLSNCLIFETFNSKANQIRYVLNRILDNFQETKILWA